MKIGEQVNATGRLVDKSVYDEQYDKITMMVPHTVADFEDARVILVHDLTWPDGPTYYYLPRYDRMGRGGSMIPSHWVSARGKEITHDDLLRDIDEGRLTVDVVVDGEGNACNPENFKVDEDDD